MVKALGSLCCFPNWIFEILDELGQLNASTQPSQVLTWHNGEPNPFNGAIGSSLLHSRKPEACEIWSAATCRRLPLRDMSRSFKARTCPRTPKAKASHTALSGCVTWDAPIEFSSFSSFVSVNLFPRYDGFGVVEKRRIAPGGVSGCARQNLSGSRRGLPASAACR